MILILRGYHPQKISGKALYVNQLYAEMPHRDVFFTANPLNRLHPKASFLLRGKDIRALYPLQVARAIRATKNLEEIVVDSQENLFILPLVMKLAPQIKKRVIFYDFASPEATLPASEAKWLSQVDAITVMTEVMKQELLRKVPSITAEKIEIYPHLVNAKVFQPRHAAAPGEFPERYILYVGSEQDRKNFFTLLEAFSRIHDRYPDLYFVKIGKDQARSNRQRLLSLLQQNEVLKNHFVLIDECSEERLVRAYQQATLFCSVTLYEGFGIPLLEAMACGCPVVASSIPTTREICGEAIEYVSDYKNPAAVATSLDRVLAKASYAQELAKKGLVQAGRFLTHE